MSPSSARITVPSSAISWRFSRSSGPGGQHVNTSDTKAELICDLTQLSGPESVVERIIARFGSEPRVVASSQRSQSQNRKMATQILADKLESAANIPPRRRPTMPTWGSTQNRLDEKRKASMRKAQRRRQVDEWF